MKVILVIHSFASSVRCPAGRAERQVGSSETIDTKCPRSIHAFHLANYYPEQWLSERLSARYDRFANHRSFQGLVFAVSTTNRPIKACFHKWFSITSVQVEFQVFGKSDVGLKIAIVNVLDHFM